MSTLQTPDLKGSSFTLSVLHLPNNQIANTTDFLQKKVDQAPTFFAGAPVILNTSKVEGEIDFNALKKGITDTGMIPVGITGCKDKKKQQQARDAGFAIMTSTNNPKNAPTSITPTKIISTPVRSGQQIYAKDSDLVILSHVSAGAEVIADGSIHIHGTLRGKAIAGASGLREATVICNDLQAELISIAGNYWLSDQIEAEYIKKKVIFRMIDDALQLEILSI